MRLMTRLVQALSKNRIRRQTELEELRRKKYLEFWLDNLLREGDEVEVITSETRSGYGNNPRQKGDRGIVVGYEEEYEPRFPISDRLPGVYSVLYLPKVAFPDQIQLICTAYLKPVDWNVLEGREKRHSFLIRELPDTPFWEDDLVKCPKTAFLVSVQAPPHVQSGEEMWRVTQAENPEDESYQLVLVGSGGSIRTSAEANDLVLHRRGNFWRPAHGLPVEFESWLEEVEFYHNSRTAQKVGSERFSDQAVRQAIDLVRESKIDFFVVTTGVYNMRDVVSYRLNDPDAGNRIRPAFLSSWADWKSEADATPR